MIREEYLWAIIIAESIWLGLFLWHPPKCTVETIRYIQSDFPAQSI